MTPLINTQIVQAALMLYKEFGGNQTNIESFGLSSEQLATKSAFFPSKPFVLFMNYLLNNLAVKDVYPFLDKLVSQVSIPDTFEYFESPPATAGEGLNQMVKISRKLMPHSTIRTEEGVNQVAIKREKHVQNVKDETAAELYTLVYILRLLAILSGKRECQPLAIQLISAQTPRLEQVFANWPECQLSYGKESTCIILPKEWLSFPVTCSADRFGKKKELAVAYSFVDSIKYSMDSYIGQPNYNIDTIADNHGVSARTLQYQLNQYDKSYQELKDEVLLDNVRHLFKQRQLNLTTIAHALGYASLSQFSRSIKRLTGLSPSAYRKTLTQ